MTKTLQERLTGAKWKESYWYTYGLAEEMNRVEALRLEAEWRNHFKNGYVRKIIDIPEVKDDRGGP